MSRSIASAKMVKVVSAPSEGRDIDSQSSLAQPGAQNLLAGLRCESVLAPGVYRYHARRVASVVYRVLGDDPELPDLVQETFVRALVSVGKFRGGAASLDAWLTRIAVYAAHAQIRRCRVRRRLFSAENCEHAPHPAAAVATPVQVDALQRTYRVLASLPAQQRVPLALYMIDEMTLSEIAAACGLSQSTAKRRVQRGKHRFEKLAMRDPVLRDWVTGADS